MKIRTSMRHIRDAFKSLFRNGWMSFGAISAVSMTLILVAVFVAGLLNVNKIASDVERDVSVRVYIDIAADEAKQAELQAAIQNVANVASVTFRSKDEELEDIKKSVSQSFELFENDKNPLHDAFDVTATDPQHTKQVAETIEQLEYVSRVNYGGATADNLLRLTSGVQTVGLIVIAGLVLIAVFLISNTIRSTIYARRNEIEIMKLVGATNSFIRWPFFIEGGLIGLIGSIIPISIIWILYSMIYGPVMDFFAGTIYSILPPNPFLYYLTAGIAGIGIIIGSLGSVLSVRRFLKI